jgi:2-C-methyl-D-erythritol 4-phosphate cytidylyltransferase
LRVFDEDKECSGIILSIHPEDENQFRDMIRIYDIQKVISMVHGGKERQDSVYSGVKVLGHEGIVLVHDAARPFIEKETIHSLVREAESGGAAIAAVPVKDTIKKAEGCTVTETIERSSLWAVQTPQAFRISVLRKAHEKAVEDDFTGTDDASLVERLHHKVAIIEGDYDNIKLTTPEDMFFGEAILKKRKQLG